MARQNGKSKWADSPAELKARRQFNATLPSGARVTLRTITLDELAAMEALPMDLKAAALMDGLPGLETGAETLFIERMVQETRAGNIDEATRLSGDLLALYERIVTAAVIEPEPTPAVVEAFDGFDREMIVALAQRRTNRDATLKVVTGPALSDMAGFREEPGGPADSGEGGTPAVEIPAPVA